MSRRLWIYGGCITARDSSGATHINAATLLATSEEEARGVLLAAASDNFPESEGWRNHSAVCAGITEDQLRLCGQEEEGE